jgi:acyl-CoA synthetase (AMP-forming)/AMP-acid ligase II
MADASGRKPETLAALSGWAAARYGDATFLESWSGRRGTVQTLSFRAFHLLELAARDELSAVLLDSGLPVHGGRVAVLSHACADSLAFSLAVTAIGRTLVCLNWRQPAAVLLELLHGLGCDILAAGRSLGSLAREVISTGGARGQRLSLLLLLDGSAAELDPPLGHGERSFSIPVGGPGVGRLGSPHGWALDPGSSPGAAPGAPDRAGTRQSTRGPDTSGGPPLRPVPAVTPSDTAVIMFTSGTSSTPKPVPLTHGGLLWSCAAKAEAERVHLGLSLVAKTEPSGPAKTKGDGQGGGGSGCGVDVGSGGSAEHRGTLAFLPLFHVIGFTNNFLYNLTVRHIKPHPSPPHCTWMTPPPMPFDAPPLPVLLDDLPPPPVQVGARACLHLDAPTTPLTAPLLCRACAELRPSILDTVPALLEAMIPMGEEAVRALRQCDAVLYGERRMERPALRFPCPCSLVLY